MTRYYIKDNSGHDIKIDGKRVFWTDDDGDSNPDKQTVYKDIGTFGGSTKIDKKYNPSKNEFW